jgi:anaerobic selenocysteine-containing dehydrogenase
MGIEQSALDSVRQTIADTQGDVVLMFGGELGPEAQAVFAQLPPTFAGDGRRILLHPLPLFNNSIGAHDMGLMTRSLEAGELLERAGEQVRAIYMAGSFLSSQLNAHPDALSRLDFLVVQELFETDTTAFADVVLPAASFAEIDGTFTNNGGLVQRVRQSILPLNQSKPDWIITAQLSAELGVDFGFEMSASAVFNEIATKVPAYAGLRYPLLKDETKPMQVKHALVESADLTGQLQSLRNTVEALPEPGAKITVTPAVGHELFKIGTLTDKVPQFHLLAAGNPRPETVLISPLYQITVDAKLQETVEIGD